MSVEGGNEQTGRTSAWTWIAAGIAVLFVRVVLIAIGDGNDSVEEVDAFVLLAAGLIVVGLVRGAMDWRNRRGR